MLTLHARLQEVPLPFQELVIIKLVERRRVVLWRVSVSGAVQRRVVVLERVRQSHLETVQGEGQGLCFLEGEQVREAEQAGQGVQVVVVDEGGARSVEAVQGEGQGVVVLEGQRLRCWTVS